MEFDFGRRLKQARQQKEWTQKELSEKAGVSQNSLSAYENLGKVPSLEVGAKIAKALGVSLDSLCGGSENSGQTQMTTFADVAKALLPLFHTELRVHIAVGVAYEDDTGDPYNIALFQMHHFGMTKFFGDLQKMWELMESGTIDEDVYTTWLEKRIEKLEDFPLQLRRAPEPDASELPF